MPLEPGVRLGPYRIVAPLGAGGMGEVYRAHHESLDREVALKVLPARVATDAEALARFEREAKAIAALSHPNILAIHDFVQADGQRFAVMELLEGQTLRDALSGGPLPPKKAVEYGRQVAEGLAAAHEKGVVHRDLKPENLYVTRDGRVKILDFGLARVDAAPDASQTSSPTVARGTEPGTVMGTAGYMAPEQVRGEPADHRADVFAFGAVLHEMLAGRRAFERATAAETMTAILREDPAPLATLRDGVPPAVERVVEHCLEKRPEDRFQSARDLAFALGGASSISGRSGSAALAASPPRRPIPAAAVAAIAAILGLAGGALLYRQLAPATPVSGPPGARYLTYSGHDYAPAASPDGRTLAFRSDRDGRARIWLKQLASGVEAPLSDGPDDLPSFSPDGSTVLFSRYSGVRSSLFKVALLGGDARRVIDDAIDGTFSPDGQRIAFLRPHAAAPGKSASVSVMLAGADGGGPRELARLDEVTGLGPRFSPDGRKIVLMVSGISGGSYWLRVVDVEKGSVETAVNPSTGSRPWASTWTPDGRLAYTSGTVSAGTLAGSTGRIAFHDLRSGATSLVYASPDSLGRIALLPPDRMVIEQQSFRQNVVEWTVDGSARRLSHGRAADRQPIYTPDGRSVVFSSDRSGNLDLWSVSVATGELRQLTDDPGDDWDPGLGPGGRLYWSSNRTGRFEIWTAEADGSDPRQVTRDDADAENPAVTPDGHTLVYGTTRPTEAGIWKMSLPGPASAPLVRGLLGIPEMSPDGQHILYLGFDNGLQGTAIQVVRLADGQPVDFRIELGISRRTTANVGRARWIEGGSAIAFLGQDERGTNGIFTQDFAPGRDTRATRRKLVGFDPDVDAETFGVSPDGRRVAIAGREMVSSLVLLEGVAGLAPAASSANRR